MKGCVTGKRVFDTEALAEEALLGARVRYDFAKGAGPVGVYLCEHCGGYHLTSQGEMNARLAAALKEGTIDRQKEAEHWQDKLKKRRS